MITTERKERNKKTQEITQNKNKERRQMDIKKRQELENKRRIKTKSQIDRDT